MYNCTCLKYIFKIYMSASWSLQFQCNRLKFPERFDEISIRQISRTDFSAARCTKAQQSPIFSTSRSMESLPSQNSEGGKLIVPAVAKVSQPCVILIGLMPTSYSATHTHFPSPRAFSALFHGSAIAAWKTRHLEVSCRTYVQDPPRGFLRQRRYKPTAVNCIATVSPRFSFSFISPFIGCRSGFNETFCRN